MAEGSSREHKILRKKEKLLVTSNFSFFQQCFPKTCAADTAGLEKGWIGKGFKSVQQSTAYRAPLTK